MKIKIILTLVVAFLAPIAANAFSIVPPSCQDSDGCNICEVALAFTNAADIIAGLLGAVALLFFIIGGFFLILSSGNEQRIETGKKILVGTVTGLAIVFLAWFAVNFVVRVAYQGSNPDKSGGISESSADSNVTVFGVKTSWWALPTCSPSLTKCAGKYIGEACGNIGDCAGGGSCTCFRATAKEGDNNTCSGTEEDATSLSAAAATTKKECYCATPCTQQKYIAYKTNGGILKEYSCIEKTAYEADAKLKAPKYQKIDNISCATTTQVCVIPK